MSAASGKRFHVGQRASEIGASLARAVIRSAVAWEVITRRLEFKDIWWVIENDV